MSPPADLLAWAVALNTLIVLATTVYNLMSTRATKALKAIEALVERLDTDQRERKEADAAILARFHMMESRVQALESDIRHLPDRDHAQRMEVALEKMSGALGTLDARLSGRMDAFNAQLQPVAAIAERMQELLMEGARR